jgi:hypothetical protein
MKQLSNGRGVGGQIGAPASLDSMHVELVAHRRALLASLLISAWMVEARDPYTGGHLWRVAQMAHILALASGQTPRDASRVAMAGFLHDLGKVGISDAILRKPGRLTDEEFAVIRTHPRIGARMVAGHPFASFVLAAIHHHHEMPNGQGYPGGLSGEQIPLDAKLVGLCDAFDAMTSTRPYRQGMTINKAVAIIESELGRQFDQHLGLRFVQLAREGAFDAVVGHSDAGVPLQHCPDCGPTLVRSSKSLAGDHLGCPACSAQFRWEESGEALKAVKTGAKASPEEMEPGLDRDQIETLVLDWEDALAPS